MNIVEKVPAILPIGHQPWLEEFPSETKGSVKICYTEQIIELEYTVSADEFLGRYKGYMDPVYTDSCAEFFLTIDNEHYYNLEFGLLGGKLFGCKHIESREEFAIPQERSELITVQSELYRESEKVAQLYPPKGELFSGENPYHSKGENLRWSLQVSIPVEFFLYPQVTSFKDLEVGANFYLCGDSLENPYFVSWNNLPSEGKPNFHQPSHFGKLKLS